MENKQPHGTRLGLNNLDCYSLKYRRKNPALFTHLVSCSIRNITCSILSTKIKLRNCMYISFNFNFNFGALYKMNASGIKS